MGRVLCVLIVAALVSVTGIASADVLNLASQSEIYVYYTGSENYTYNGSAVLRVGYYDGYYNSLMKFDLSSIPSSSTISNATLTLQVGTYEQPSGGPVSFSINKIIKDWNETSVVFMGDNGGLNNIYYDSNGSYANNEFFWQTPIVSYQPDGSIYTLNFNLTSTAQEWLAGSNFGILLKDEFAQTGHQGDIMFLSKNLGAAFAPELSLNYTPNAVPEPVSTTLFLLGGATLAVRRLRKK